MTDSDRSGPLGVPWREVLAVFALWAGLVLVALRASDPALRATVVALGHVVLTGAALWANLQRAKARPAEARAWHRLAGAGVVVISFEALVAANSIWPDRFRISAAAWLVQTVAANSLMLGGLLALPYETRSAARRFRTGLDGAIFASGAFLLLWGLGLRELILQSTSPGLERVESFFSYGANALALGVIVYLAARDMSRLRGVLGWFAIALATLTTGTALVLVGRLEGTFQLGGIAELVQLAAYPCFVLAPRVRQSLQSMDRRSSSRQQGTAGGDLLTYASLSLAIPIVVRETWSSPSRGILVGVSVAAVLVLLRQFLAMRDVRALSMTLEARVAERTRELEASVRALERAQRLEAVGRVAGSVAHDFNNMLTVVRTSAEMVRDETPPDDARQVDIEAIVAASQTGERLARQLLQFSRGGTAPSAGSCDFRVVMGSLDWLVRSLATDGVRVDVENLATNVLVPLPAAQTEQVLANLLNNARDAMPNGGRVIVRATNADAAPPEAAAPSTSSHWLQLRIEDNGAGIPAEVLPRVFEPYVTTKAAGRGTGLGLATVYAVVHGIGGGIVLESQPGCTRFDLWLPLGAVNGPTDALKPMP